MNNVKNSLRVLLSIPLVLVLVACLDEENTAPELDKKPKGSGNVETITNKFSVSLSSIGVRRKSNNAQQVSVDVSNVSSGEMTFSAVRDTLTRPAEINVSRLSLISESLMEGDLVVAGQTYDKSWQLENTGNTEFKQVVLVPVNGSRDTGLSVSIVDELRGWKPGETRTVTVGIIVPENVGQRNHIQVWRLVDKAGNSIQQLDGSEITVSYLLQSADKENQAPIVNAGVDQFVEDGEEVVLSGSGTDVDGSIVSYRWSENSVELSRSETFTKSDFSPGAHLLMLTVVDNFGAEAVDTVLVTVSFSEGAVGKLLREGLYTLESNSRDIGCDSVDGCRSVYTYRQNVMRTNRDDLLSFENYEYSVNSEAFEKSVDVEPHNSIKLSDSGWVSGPFSVTSINNENGSVNLIERDSLGGIVQAVLVEFGLVDLEGTHIFDTLDPGWQATMHDENAIYTEGAVEVSLAITNLQNVYELISEGGGNCGIFYENAPDVSGNCNSVKVGDRYSASVQYATDLSDLFVETAWERGSRFESPLGQYIGETQYGRYELRPELLADGTVNYFQLGGEAMLLGSGEWRYETVRGKVLITFTVPDEIVTDFSGDLRAGRDYFYAVQNGYVRMGSYRVAGSVKVSEPRFLSDNAMKQVLDNFSRLDLNEYLGEVAKAKLNFEEEVFDLESGVSVCSEYVPGDCFEPRPGDFHTGDFRVSYNSNTAIHSRIYAQYPVKVMFIQKSFSSVSAFDVIDELFVYEGRDVPFEYDDTAIILTADGNYFKIGNAVEDSTGLTFDYQQLFLPTQLKDDAILNINDYP